MTVVVLAGVAAAAAGVAIGRPFGGKPQQAAIDSDASTAVETVTRGGLTARTQVNGTLSYAGRYTVVNQASGTVTKLPRTRQIVRQGAVLYRVNGKPVVLLEGSSPVYRELSKGTKGPDVKQLNTDLVALGYATRAQLNPGSATFSAATAYAMKRLQRHLGVGRTGKLALGQAVFIPAYMIRITKVTATLGAAAPAGATLLQGSSVDRKVTAAVTVGSVNVKVGDRVTIMLPDGRTTPGRVSSVGTVATKSSTGGSTIRVSITPTKSSATGTLDQAPVTVSIITASVKDVLTVPVNALLALAGGGYALEVMDPGGGRRLVPVTLGLFDDEAGKVQVSGAGVTDGQRVVVPAT